MYFEGVPLYPFGHGLSYTTFKDSNLQVTGRTIKQLVGFERIRLPAGASKTVRFTLRHDEPALSYWDEGQHEFVVNPGTVDLMLGSSSADIRLRHQIKIEA